MPVVLAVVIALAFYRLYAGTGEFSDEGSFCAISQGLLAGLLPYRDYFNEKPPLQYVWTAAVMHVVGSGIAGARVASGITLFLTLASILIQTARRQRAFLAAATLLTATGILMRVYNNSAESSLAALLVGSAAVLFGTRQTKCSATRAGIAGALLGLAVGFRVTAALAAVVPFVSPWLTGLRRHFALGFVVGVGFWIGWLAAAGVFHEAVAAILLFHLDNPAVGTYFRGLGGRGLAGFLAWLLVLAFGWSRVNDPRDRLWIILWATSAAAPFFGRMDAFRLWPSTALLLALVGLRTDGRMSVPGWALVGLRTDGRMSVPGWAPVLPIVILCWFGSKGVSTFQSAEQIAAGVRRHSAQTDRIWVGPFSPTVYCLSGRLAASRYYFILPWIAKPDVQRELMNDMRAHRPELIVEVLNSGWQLDSLLPELKPWLNREYFVVESNSRAQYWRRKHGPQASDGGTVRRS